MRFLRLSLAPELGLITSSSNATNVDIRRVEVINNRYLSDGTVVELSRIESGQEGIRSLLEDNPATIDYEIFEAGGTTRYVYHHLEPGDHDFARQLISLLDDHRLVILYPIRFDVTAGTTVDLVGTTEMVQQAYNRLPAEIQQHATVERVSETVPVTPGLRSLLTDRQREVLDVAVDLGYYSVPREATAEHVAAAVGCAPSTASEHLRKIESRVLSRLAV